MEALPSVGSCSMAESRQESTHHLPYHSALSIDISLAGASYRLLGLIWTANVQLLCVSCLYPVGVVSGTADSVCKQN